LDERIAKIREMRSFVRESAPAVAEVVEVDLAEQVEAGRSPDGEKWRPRKDGGRPLRTAASALRVAAIGTRVFVRLTGHVARHHLGTARGGIVRQILPTGGVPDSMNERIRVVLVARFEQVMGGRNG
jgi:hypothetical protein